MSPPGATLKEQLFELTRRRYRTAKVEGIEFCFQSLTEAERSRFEKQVLNKSGAVRDDSRRRLLIMVLVDPKDKKTYLTDSDMQELGELDGKLTGKLFDHAMAHTGFTDDDMEILEKN